jgi:type III restriction enzyme
VAEVVRHVTERLIELTIDVPQITILPTREVNYRFQEFALAGLEKINSSRSARNCCSGIWKITSRHVSSGRAPTTWRPEDYIVRQLIDQDAIDYDEHADLLYALAGQLVARLREHLGGDEAKLENVLIYWQRQLADFIWTQMQQHVWITPTDYVGKVTQGFDVLKPASFTLAAGEHPRDFRAPIADKRLVRQMVFKGFKKCCYPTRSSSQWMASGVLPSCWKTTPRSSSG